MEIINFKCIENENIFSINDLVDYDIAINKLQEKLVQLKENNIDNNNVCYTIDFGKRLIGPSELLELFDIFLNEEYILINKINCINKINSQIEIYENTIRAGQYLSFDNSVLILGDVNPNATVVAKNNVYIVGKSYGKIICISKDSKISASSFNNSIIQIYDSKLEIINNKDSCTLVYDNKNIILTKNSQLKGERNVKSNSCYIG